jgi:hypothetical protein
VATIATTTPAAIESKPRIVADLPSCGLAVIRRPR